MADFSQLDARVDASIAKIDSYVKNPKGSLPMDDELNGLLQSLNSITNTITDSQEMQIHNLRIQRLTAKIKEYDKARTTIQIQTRTDLIGVGAGRTQLVDSAKESMKELDLKSVESFIRMTNALISSFGSVDRITLQGIRSSMILEKIQSSGYQYQFTQKGLELQSHNPEFSPKAAELTIAIDTLIKTGVITLEELKYGLLYTSPSFDAFAQSSRLSDGTPNPNVNIQDYITFLKKKPQDQLTPSEKSVLESQGALTSLKMPELIQSFQSLGQVSTLLAAHPGIVLQGQNTSNAITQPSAAGSSGPIQDGVNTVAGKGGEFAGAIAGNIGGFAGGVSQALGEGFKQGGAVGGLAVAVIGIMGAWKFLNGEWGTKNHKLSGWMIALLGFGGKSAYDMAKKYGLIDEAEERVEQARKPKKKAEGTPSSDSDQADADPDPDQTSKPGVKPAENKDLSPSQLAATKKVSDDVRITSLFNQKRETYTATKDEYINFINKDLKDKPLSVFFAPKDQKHNITSIVGTLDPSIILPPKMDPLLLKDILRIYILGLSLKPSELATKQSEITSAIQKLDMNKDTVQTAIQKTYNISEAPIEDISKKIGAYEILMDGKAIPKDNINVEILEAEEGGYIARISIKDPKKIKTKSGISPDSVEAFQVDFDNTGKLETANLSIKAKVGPLSPVVKYKLSQNGNQITMIEA